MERQRREEETAAAARDKQRLEETLRDLELEIMEKQKELQSLQVGPGHDHR